MDDGKTKWYLGEYCPRCGGDMATDGRRVWCAGEFGEDDTDCGYGADDAVLLRDV